VDTGFRPNIRQYKNDSRDIVDWIVKPFDEAPAWSPRRSARSPSLYSVLTSIELRPILCVDDEKDVLEVVKLCVVTTGGCRVSCRDGVL
jgi:hypothetical protein